MSSIVWNFFEKPDGAADTVPCPLCKTVLVYKGTTSGLMKHLKGKHTQEYQMCLEMQAPNQIQYQPHTETLQSLLAQAFCSGRIPFCFAENPEFIRFCKSLNPNFEIPSALNVRSDVNTMINEQGYQARRVLQGVKDYVLITDECSSLEDEDKSLHISFVDPITFERSTLFLSCTNDTSYIERILEKYNLKLEDCIGSLSDYLLRNPVEEDHVWVVQGMKNIQCAGMQINEIIEKFWYTKRLNQYTQSRDPSPSNGLTMFYQEVVQSYSVVFNCDRTNDEKEHHFRHTDYKLSMGHIQKWGSEFVICQKFLASEPIFYNGRYFVRDAIVDPDLYARVQKIVDLVTPLYNALMELSKETSFISDIVPSLLSAKEELEEDEEHKERLEKLIQEKITSYLSEDLILIATLCDPRYAYIPELIEPKTWKNAEELVLKLETPNPELLTPKKESTSAPKVSGVGGLLKRKLNYEDSEKNMSSELLHYQAIISSHRPVYTSDPLQFWKMQQQSFPKLTKIAVKYLTFMATTSPAEKLHNKTQAMKFYKVDIKDDIYKMGDGVILDKFKPILNNYLDQVPDNLYQFVPEGNDKSTNLETFWGVKQEN
ncbi:hypothetical protein CAEBREN_24267 [Caenorhabditis brenneri]|uniref:BED-type domain-containing protein n=1 Tax=Caenorhabditis brenneri TaxID=135651 RepID=G0M9M6_CAEBE|nr:hypothetical protein CAEBREN_24267 [Caenorhabditis brenneri]